MDQDPGEHRNLSGERADQVSELRQHADAQEQIARSQKVGGGATAELSAAEQEALHALGYLEEPAKPGTKSTP